MGETYSFTFDGAGKYVYDDPSHPSTKGKVAVPITVQYLPGTLNTAQVLWGAAQAPAGFAFDVQIKPPHASSFMDWRTAVVDPSGTFGPTDPFWIGPGTYRFQARIRNVTNGAASGFSEGVGIKLRS